MPSTSPEDMPSSAALFGQPIVVWQAGLQELPHEIGPTMVRQILGDAGLFSTTASRTILACTTGCELDGGTQYSWPQWSHDAATAAKIEAAHLRALRLASR